MSESGIRAALRRRLRRHSGVDALADAAHVEFERVRGELAGLRAEAGDRQAELEERIRELEAQARIPVVMEWARRAPLADQPLVSVVMPTRDRCELLPRAIASVVRQSYERWELVVVNDGSTDETPRVLAEVGDDRVRSVRTEGIGATGARNAGLDAARGELIAYLDDDNLMHEGWLRTVVWAFALRPETEVAYGAFVIDDPERVDGSGVGDLAKLVFRPFDRARLASENPADMSAIAHRAGLPDARFDETLRMYGDWEMFARLVRDREPFAVPAIATFYGTDARSRISALPIGESERAAVRRACAG